MHQLKNKVVFLAIYYTITIFQIKYPFTQVINIILAGNLLAVILAGYLFTIILAGNLLSYGSWKENEPWKENGS